MRRQEDNARTSGRRNKPLSSSCFQVAGAGLQYDPSLEYENDAAILIGHLSNQCKYCSAKKFEGEPPGMCCSGGKVSLPHLECPPQPLKDLLSNGTDKSEQFLRNIRKYNSAFQMTSFGASKEIAEPGFMPTFKVQGQVYHLIGSLEPLPQEDAKFLQIYFAGNSQSQCQKRCENCDVLDKDIVLSLQNMLATNNVLVHNFVTMREKTVSKDYKIIIRADKRPVGEHARRYNAPASDEIAILLVGEPHEKRDIVIEKRGGKLQRVCETHRCYDALQYPLMFWQGQDGYNFNIPQIDPSTKKVIVGKKVSSNDYYAYMIMIREFNENFLLLYRDLFHQYLVDMYAKVESERLLFIRKNQKQLRAENYIHLKDAIAHDGNVQNVGQLVVLPSTFTGGPRYMHERTQDAMTYVRTYGRPDLFITFTCNPKWDEIKHELFEGQKPQHRHDLIARVFHQKHKKMMNLLVKYKIFGEIRCYMYTIEWQKRGLPHAHILVWLKKKLHADKIDSLITAEIPDKNIDPLLYDVVKTQMVHGPCGPFNFKSPCMSNGKCTKKYPKAFVEETQTGEDSYPVYRRRAPDQGGFTTKIRQGSKLEVDVDNRWIVPYSPVLCRIFNAHINVEFCNSIKSIKYVCKYVNKGSDMAMVGIQELNKNDEISCYQMARYISSNEAVWRLLCFPIHERFPTVVHLAVHLENGQRIYFDPKNKEHLNHQLENPKGTTLTAFFDLNKKDSFASTLLYYEIPSYYTWNRTLKTWKRRVVGEIVTGCSGIKKDSALGRVYTVHPNNFECYFLRLLLHVVRGPKSFVDLKSVNGENCETYREACFRRGLLEDDIHWEYTLKEATISSSPFQLRNLFAIMLHTCDLANPKTLWETFKEDLCEDVIFCLKKKNPAMEIKLTNDIVNEGLCLLQEKVLLLGGKHICDYGLPSPRDKKSDISQELLRETSYDIEELKDFISKNEPKLQQEQKAAYNQILKESEQGKGCIFFIDAPGGTGKTFLTNLLLAKIRSKGTIALAVASSGIAATLLTGGRTAHSVFKLPLNLTKNETPMCNISKNSSKAYVLQRTKLIVWDECTMSHRGALEAVDRTLKDIRDTDCVMGGITMVLSGDFRQTLPVIPKGTKADELKACLKASPLWQGVKRLSLVTNMRTLLSGDKEAGQFAKKLLEIGDGDLPLNQTFKLHQLPCGNMAVNVDELKESVFPNLKSNYTNTMWLCERAILAPKNDAVNVINFDLLQQLPGLPTTYDSIDTVLDEDQAVQYPTEFLNSLNPPGLPPHELFLKVGAPIMLLRNLDPPRLCNGTRMVIKTLRTHVLEATIITGSYKGEDVLIPRIPLIPTDIPFEFKRLQFPIRLSFAMSINKSQGQSLKQVGLNLISPCFSHGQLYVGCSRVGSSKGLFICCPEKGFTENVVYQEALKN